MSATQKLKNILINVVYKSCIIELFHWKNAEISLNESFGAVPIRDAS